MTPSELITHIGNAHLDEALEQLYENVAHARGRYAELAAALTLKSDKSDVAAHFFSVPGRIELCGNHLDHQHGHVVCTSVDRDVVACASRSDETVVVVASKGYPEERVSLSDLSPVAAERGRAAALIRGVLSFLRQKGYRIGGFTACTHSQIPGGSGLSSSAAFEILIGLIISHFYNNGAIPIETLAEAGRFAENEFFDKPSGLMDQLACATGGVILVDLKSGTSVTPLPSLTCGSEHRLVIIEAGDSHGGLSSIYADIVEEMCSVAHFFHCRYLREVHSEDFYVHLPEIIQALPDRAVLRAFHYFSEFERVDNLKMALQEKDFRKICHIIRQSGLSSYCLLQNGYVPGEREHQPVSIVLALCERELGKRGAYRLHGGGFGGTVLALVPAKLFDRFQLALERVLGDGHVYPIRERQIGAICVY